MERKTLDMGLASRLIAWTLNCLREGHLPERSARVSLRVGPFRCKRSVSLQCRGSRPPGRTGSARAEPGPIAQTPVLQAPLRFTPCGAAVQMTARN